MKEKKCKTESKILLHICRLCHLIWETLCKVLLCRIENIKMAFSIRSKS